MIIQVDLPDDMNYPSFRSIGSKSPKGSFIKTKGLFRCQRKNFSELSQIYINGAKPASAS